MAHGNFSDLVFVALFLIALQLWFMPNLNFGSGVWTDEHNTDDTTNLMQLAGAQLIFLGTLFSGVKWDPQNGRVGGVGGIFCVVGICAAQYSEDDDVFTLNLIYLYAFVYFAGSVYILLFSQNPIPVVPARPNSWGQCPDFIVDNFNVNWVDAMVAIMLYFCILCMKFPADYLMKDLDFGVFFGDGSPEGSPHFPVRHQISADGFVNPVVYVLIKFNAFTLMFICAILVSVGWNRINGKMAGVGGIISSLLICFFTYRTGVAFVFKPAYIMAFCIAFEAIHISVFPSFPYLPPQDKDKVAATTQQSQPLLA